MTDTTTGPMGLNLTMLMQIFNFLVLVLLLRIFAYKPVKRILEQRTKRIQDTLDKADADKAAAAKTLADYQRQLAAAREKAQTIVDSAERVAAQNRETSIAETKREIEQMRAAARAEIERDHERAKDDIRKEIVSLSMLAAGKIVEKSMTSDENKALVENFISTLDKNKIGELPC